jgi:alkylhydroperoxidase family enzyme
MCAWAEKLTRAPETAGADDVQALRRMGWSDLQIHDAAQVIAYFNYVNRIADGLGVDDESPT